MSLESIAMQGSCRYVLWLSARTSVQAFCLKAREQVSELWECSSAALQTIETTSLSAVEDGSCSLFIHKNMWINGPAVWVEPRTAALFLKRDSSFGGKNPHLLSQGGGDQTEWGQELEHVAGFTLNMGGTCNMFQEVNFSLKAQFTLASLQSLIISSATL